MLFSNADFTLMHFTNFNFPSFELPTIQTIFFFIIRAFENYFITRVITTKWFLVISFEIHKFEMEEEFLTLVTYLKEIEFKINPLYQICDK